MSPEVTAGLNEQVPNEGYSMEVDWWSLGCVFWEMLLGVPPIQGNNQFFGRLEFCFNVFLGETPDEVFDCIINWSNILPALLEQYKAYMTPECFDLLTGYVLFLDRSLLQQQILECRFWHEILIVWSLAVSV